VAHVQLGAPPDGRQLPVREAALLGLAEQAVVARLQAGHPPQRALHLDDLEEIVEEPRVHAAQLVDLLDRHAVLHGVTEMPEALVVGAGQAAAHVVHTRLVRRAPEVLGVAPEAEAAHLQPPEGLLEGLLEGAPDGHGLAHALHLRGEIGAGLGEFLEGEAGDLDDYVVDRRLEAGLGQARDVVGQLVQAVADGQLGGDLGDGEAGGLRGQCAGAAHARVHLDDHHASGLRVDGELHVRTASVHADLAQAAQRAVAHHLIFAVGQGLRRSHRDGIAGMHAHRVEVLDRADDDGVVGQVAHHFELEFFPAQRALFDEHFVHGR